MNHSHQPERHSFESRSGPQSNRRSTTTLLFASASLIFGSLAFAVIGWMEFLASHSAAAMGFPAAMALATLRFLQTLAFQPAALLPSLCGILILFIALTGMLVTPLVRDRRSEENAS